MSEKTREMAMTGVTVGKWVENANGFDVFEPLQEQPPEGVASDVRKVEAWLKERGEEGEYALIRQYALNVKIEKVTKIVSSVVTPAA